MKITLGVPVLLHFSPLERILSLKFTQTAMRTSVSYHVPPLKWPLQPIGSFKKP